MRGPRFSNNQDFDHHKTSRVDWLDAFADSIERSPELKSATQANSIYDQINRAIGNSHKHATVEAVVKEYISNIGLENYLKTLAHNQIVAQAQHTQMVDVNEVLKGTEPQLKEDILTFIKNRVETYKGFVSALEIQEEIYSSFKDKIEPNQVYDRHLVKLINQLLEQEQARHPTEMNKDLGKSNYQSSEEATPENTDFFHNLAPKMQ